MAAICHVSTRSSDPLKRLDVRLDAEGRFCLARAAGPARPSTRSGAGKAATVSLIGEGLVVPRGGECSPVTPGRAGADRSGRRRIRQPGQRCCARLQHRLAAHDLFELLIELLLVEELAAGQAVDLRAQLGNAILVGVLHVRLAGDQPGQEIVAEGKIGGGRD